jgi:hypothetical protein
VGYRHDRLKTGCAGETDDAERRRRMRRDRRTVDAMSAVNDIRIAGVDIGVLVEDQPAAVRTLQRTHG